MLKRVAPTGRVSKEYVRGLLPKIPRRNEANYYPRIDSDVGRQVMSLEPEVKYSDAWLDWAELHGAPGEKYSAPYFRKVAFEHRRRAWGVASTILNLGLQNYWHYAVSDAVNCLIDGNYSETYPERVAREEREKDIQRRDMLLQSQMTQIRAMKAEVK
jgi:hypothetical protein